MTSFREAEEMVEEALGLISSEQPLRDDVETEFEDEEDITDVTTVDVAEMDAGSSSVNRGKS